MNIAKMVSVNCMTSYIKKELDNNKDVNEYFLDYTALHYSVLIFNIGTMFLLLDYKADITLRTLNKRSQTPFDMLVRSGWFNDMIETSIKRPVNFVGSDNTIYNKQYIQMRNIFCKLYIGSNPEYEFEKLYNRKKMDLI